MRDVPVGFAISTPVTWFSGDQISFYARVEGERARLEDSGSLLCDLEGQGVDFSSENRQQILRRLLREHDISFSQEENLFSTAWVPKAEIVHYTLSFLTFLTRIQDMLFLNREIVKNTFREDLAKALVMQFQEENIDHDKALFQNLPHHIVDITVTTQRGKIGAVFPATSDVAVLRAVVFSMELQKQKQSKIVPFLIYENSDQNTITKQSREIATNSYLTLGVWSGGKEGIVDKIGRYLA